MIHLFKLVILLLFIGCISLKNKEAIQPVNEFVHLWENAILNKAIEVNQNGNCDADIEYYKKYNTKPKSDDYYLVSFFNDLLQSGKIESLKDSFVLIHESTVDDHYFYLIKVFGDQQIIDKYNDILGAWTIIGTNTIDNTKPIFSENDFFCTSDCPGKLFQSAIFTTFYNGQITVDRFISQVCERLDLKLTALVKVKY
ncbi:MAG: hypothetical protein IPM42_14260 [Saprospiraceae bacterium]|nr:hypothetical protein [Saprospiraceae bacterium]